MLTKQKLQQQLESLPEEFSLDELMERLILIEKVDRGERQSLNDEVVSHDLLDQEIKKWFK